VPFSMVVVGTRVYLMLSSHNNSYQASLKMSPFETLYGRKCRTPLYWIRLGEDSSLDLNLFEAEEQVHIIRENLRVSQTR
jgi:hypothetical protein